MRAFLIRMLLPLLCAIGAPAVAQAADNPFAPGGYRWLEEGPFEGPLHMVISIERQMVHVYSGDRLVGLASVSTGMRGHRTPTGEYAILQKRQWHRSNIYSNAPMPFMQRLTWDGIALHAGYNPGYPASHGCIRLPYAFARRLFGLTQVGTVVRVTTDQLQPVLMVDAVVLADPDDPDSAVVTFAPRAMPEPVQLAALPMPQPAQQPDIPMLEIDPGIFRPRLMRR